MIPTRIPLSPRQLHILALIRSGPISHRCLAETVGLVPGAGSVGGQLDTLREMGLICSRKHQAKTLQLTDQGRGAIAGYVLLPADEDHPERLGKWQAVEVMELEAAG